MSKVAMLILGIFSLSHAHASEVLKIANQFMAISHPEGETWRVQDRVCSGRGGQKQECGKIVRVSPKTMVVKLDRKFASVSKGDPVERIKSVESLPMAYELTRPTVGISAGMSGGLAMILPVVHVEYSPLRHFAFGLKGNFTKAEQDSVSVSLTGVGITAAFYFKEAFEGFYVQGGASVFQMNVNSLVATESEKLLEGMATVGYRFVLGPVDLGIAAGVEYFSPSHSQLIVPAFTLTKPVATMDIGYHF